MRLTTSARHGVGALAILLLAGAAGCGGPDAGPEAVTPTTVRVLVRDINIRAEGVDCAGTGPYLYFHHRAPFRVLDPDGAALVTGTLPAGTAVAAFDEDLGVERVPTYCEFAVPVQVPQRAGYRLEVAGRPALDLTPDTSEGPALVAVVPA
ncbi:hypothetical protein B5D80_13350 [Micromonospora wenchangensis]|uniref:Lipoprotein n=1 Tax=Micromonospora wenchangensis TaxID=1185415 RepID=A0A246RP78_9ACTN|nr:hypothetical protein [Micromonospora wenchangensis]OWV08027.1 hypothetical protein B5D80_13350 [Micromonospora wenchangensis]